MYLYFLINHRANIDKARKDMLSFKYEDENIAKFVRK